MAQAASNVVDLAAYRARRARAAAPRTAPAPLMPVVWAIVWVPVWPFLAARPAAHG